MWLPLMFHGRSPHPRVTPSLEVYCSKASGQRIVACMQNQGGHSALGQGARHPASVVYLGVLWHGKDGEEGVLSGVHGIIEP